MEEADENGLVVLKKSTFSLVDLAGSEKWALTQAPALAALGTSQSVLLAGAGAGVGAGAGAGAGGAMHAQQGQAQAQVGWQIGRAHV